MTTPHEILSSIPGILSRHPEGLRMKDLAAEVGINRNAVAKYLGILHQEGQVDIRYIGKAKVFSIAKRIPFSILAEVSPDYVLGTDRNLNCVTANARFYEWGGCTPGEILGKHIGNLPIPLFQESRIPDLARNGIASVGDPVRVSSSWQNRESTYEIRCRPVIFENCTTGCGVVIKDITETETAAAEISLLREKYRALTDAQSEYIVDSSPDGTITFVNPAFASFAKIPAEQLTGKRFHLKIPEDDLIAVRHHFRSISSDDPEKSIEHRVLAPSGDIRWVRWRNRGIFREGTLTGYHSHGTDITELTVARDRLRFYHENMEKMIREKTEEYQKINRELLDEIQKRRETERNLQKTQFCVNNSSEMILWVDEKGTITSANKSALDVLGVLPGISVPQQPVPWQDIWEHAKQDGYYLFEAILPDRSGRQLHAEVLVNHLYYDNTELCLLFVRDVTCQKQAVEALRESESRLSSIIRFAPIGIGILSDLTIRMVNNQMCRMMGYSVEEFIGETTRFLFPSQEEYDRIHRMRFNPSAQEESGSVETQWKKKDGMIIDVLLSWALIDPSDRSRGWMCTVLDITGRKRAEEEKTFNNIILSTQLEMSPDGILIVDENGKILNYNQEFVKIVGIPDDLLASRIDEPVLQLVTGKVADPEAFLSRVRYLYDHKEEKSYEEIPLKDGRILERFSAPLLGEKGNYYGRVWYFRDITMRKKVSDARQSGGT